MSDWLEQRLGLSPATQMHLWVSAIAIVGLWLLQKVVLAVVYRRVTDPYTRYRWRKATTYAFIVAGILVVGREWFTGFKTLATFLGLVSAGIAIALKDPFTNLAGWAYIVSRQPFDVGDRIEIGGHKGDVIDQAPLSVHAERNRWPGRRRSEHRAHHPISRTAGFSAIRSRATTRASRTSGMKSRWS